jgi:hypothetical protein
MKAKKETSKETPLSGAPLFDKTNLMWMLGGVAIMILGFILMAGGASDDPSVFNPDEVYSTTRITIAPIVILAGLVVLIYSIFRHPKA